jgi:hypothetical protein
VRPPRDLQRRDRREAWKREEAGAEERARRDSPWIRLPRRRRRRRWSRVLGYGDKLEDQIAESGRLLQELGTGRGEEALFYGY